MDGFGDALRAQRQAAGMRQADLVEVLHHVIARSTLANVEVGRERPSARLWQAISTHLPEWAAVLEPWYAPPEAVPEGAFRLAGPFEILSATSAWNFGAARVPEELVQVRRVRAKADNVDGYGLALAPRSGGGRPETEALWGGWVEEHHTPAPDGPPSLGGDPPVYTRFHFDRVLRRGQVHEFATRTWVGRDHPHDWVCVTAAAPAAESVITLNFTGPRPRRVWGFGPVDELGDADLLPPPPSGPRDVVQPLPNGAFTRRARLALGQHHGMGWTW